jgi:hypothetical protein
MSELPSEITFDGLLGFADGFTIGRPGVCMQTKDLTD